MADPLYIYNTDAGLVIPDTADLLAAVQAEWAEALGYDVTIDPTTPEGALIAAEVLARDAVLRTNAAIATGQLNPDYAGGIALDAIWALLGGSRGVDSKSSAEVTITGAQGTTVTAVNTKFRSSSGDLWSPASSVTIGASLSATVTVLCDTPGPVDAAAGTINQIELGVLGLETVTNPADAVPGELALSDLASKIARRRTLAYQGRNTAGAYISAVSSVPNFKSMSFYENYTQDPVTVEGVTIPGNCIYACVDGGSDADVAAALLSKKMAGTNWVGTEEYVIVDDDSGQPYPVKFSRPTEIALLARFTVKSKNPLVNPQDTVRASALAFANGELEGEEGFTVGADASPFELAAAVNSQTPSLFVVKVELTLASAPSGWATDVIDIKISEKATIDSASITVNVVP